MRLSNVLKVGIMILDSHSNSSLFDLIYFTLTFIRASLVNYRLIKSSIYKSKSLKSQMHNFLGLWI